MLGYVSGTISIGTTYGRVIFLAEREDAAKYREISEAEYETILEVEANK